ncbi:MAG: DUF3047 domain-containing protein [Pseudomonadota bacterium]
MKLLIRSVAIWIVFQLAACSSMTPDASRTAANPEALESSPWAKASMPAQASAEVWQHFKFPGKQATQFSYAREDGREALVASAKSSASLVRKVVHIPSADIGKLKFSWKVPALMPQADMSVKEADDCSVRIVLAFDGDRSRFSPKNAMLSELARLLTGEELPYATLMYVWSKKRPAGSVIVNPRTDRIRKLVVESGDSKLNSWVDYERTIRADFEKAFGEAPGALMSISVMTDSDNTQGNTQAWYGPLTISAARP